MAKSKTSEGKAERKVITDTERKRRYFFPDGNNGNGLTIWASSREEAEKKFAELSK